MARTTWLNYEKGHSKPKIDVLQKIADSFGCAVEQLLNEDLTKQKPSQSDLQASMSLPEQRGIILVPVSARAGYLSGHQDAEFIEELPRLTLPGYQHGRYRAFMIQGDSMPPLQAEDIVIGEAMEKLTDCKPGKRYIFVTRSDGIVFKRLGQIEEVYQHLILQSDNPSYQPFTVLFADILEIWSFYSFIGYAKEEITSLSDIQFQLEALTQVIKRLKP